ncbi:bifunctional DNA-binding transcriptional regulator/O6-methylguanine-DNA methyltransferase Ada [Acetobacter indonesiensis]|uniref:bifunctional DNA-binding transcriptional regulator/O6-methylguanine-DNA methyltransferase Ada n=1 Tax=Acetobacter indonesiensis TaxID=104101 RepID=UPI001F00026F|nr:bifunctional DNA-binding transcriptional regulator/O6-methylguanine-DNA methyltransferase Ada [Acetobacter indonesiensis]MCG0993915.1 bifunctional DNA-binding transcriptional regulator/O6-methylguanine-DNA methyltransferase Ada [Acetobacter indonesiensis]
MMESDKKSLGTINDPRWQKITARDKIADGQFWYSVITTGIYCRPSCPSRTPKPSNVTLHDTLESARASGCRPCKRCNPDGGSTDAANASLIEQACRLIETSEVPPSLEALANAINLSPAYFHRLFKAQTGLTPKSYASAHRARRVRDGLSLGLKITDVLYDAGFKSNGRFYAQSSAMLGMIPKHYRKGGLHEVLYFAVAECSLGTVLVASSAKGVASILLGDEPDTLVRDLQDRFPKAELIGADADYEQSIAKVIGFIEDPNRGLDLPLDVRGTAFQQRVWQALRQIPAGETATYAEVAQKIGQPTATRAVAGACAANHIAIAIPCHRVIRNDGSLSGYRWGVDRKRSLLSREGKDK